MAELILGRAARTVVHSPLCAKTGRPTTQRVVLRGSAMPAWVSLLFVFSFFAMLIAGAATSRRYVIDIPFSHEAHDKWRRGKRAAWAIGLAGGAPPLPGQWVAARPWSSWWESPSPSSAASSER